ARLATASLCPSVATAFWTGIVGGKSEVGELSLTTLFREMQEELGGTIRDPKIIPLEKFTSDRGKFIYQTFSTR
ncbi:hypothetical protein EBT16_04590, partial [bacterium]|nr:hypothetical protein [bacterium]